jgi:hypothetical protein
VVGSPISVGQSPIAFGLFIQPFIGFSAFTAQLTVYPNHRRFSIQSDFTLGASSKGINPLTEPVTLQIGEFTITIPAGSFVRHGNSPNYSFDGVIDSVDLKVQLNSANPHYIFKVMARNVSLTVSNPVTITLTIGDNSGKTTVNPAIINTGG